MPKKRADAQAVQIEAAADSPAFARRSASTSITLADIARIAGVSTITVSRALTKPGMVSEETVQRVREVANRIGYVPNLVAGGLSSRRSRLIAAVVPTIAHPVFADTIQALSDSLSQAGYQLMLGVSGYGATREDALIESVLSRRPDGIVLTGIMHTPEVRRRLMTTGIPVVETWDLTPTPIDMLVGFSHVKVGHALAGFLVRRGYRKPALIIANDQRAQQRKQGLEDGLAMHDIRLVNTVCLPAPTSVLLGREFFRNLLRETPDIDIVICSSDTLAMGVMIESQVQKLRIPDDIAVVGFGNLEAAAAMHPSLTTVQIDGRAIGEQAARFLLACAEDKAPEERIIDVGFKILERDSA